MYSAEDNATTYTHCQQSFKKKKIYYNTNKPKSIDSTSNVRPFWIETKIFSCNISYLFITTTIKISTTSGKSHGHLTRWLTKLLVFFIITRKKRKTTNIHHQPKKL